MPILSDGTVIPSHQGVSSESYRSHSTGLMGLWGVKVGVVRDVIYRDDKRSQSKKFTEYLLEVQLSDSQGRPGVTQFSGVGLASLFGGRADMTRIGLRPVKNTDDQGLGPGAKVLVVFVDGNRQRPIILAGVRDQDDDPDPTGAGAEYVQKFNGVHQEVLDDGTWRVTRNGPTDYVGKLRDGEDSSLSGAVIEFDAKGQAKVYAPKRVTIASGGEKVVLESSTAVLVGSENANEALVLGTTWRQEEKQFHDSLQSQLQSLSTDLGQAGGALATAGTAMAVPVTGAVAAGPQIATASTALIKAAADVGQILAALKKYEAGAANILSKKHKTE